MELWCELVELIDGGEDGGTSCLEAPGCAECRLERSQLGLVHASGGLLPVAGHEGHRVTLVKECNCTRYALPREPELVGTLGDDDFLRLGRERAGIDDGRSIGTLSRRIAP